MEKVNVVVTIVIAIFASTGFWSFIQKIYENHKKKGEESVERQALRGLLYRSLIDQCSKVIDRGSISIKEYQELKKYTYDPYKKLEGNGIAEELMERVKDLISVKEEQNHEN